MSPIRIALVITELEVGGAEQCLVRLATGLDRVKFEPVVYSLAPLPATGKDRLVRELTGARIEVQSLQARRWWHFPRALRQLAALLRRQQPQIVQTFLFHANVVGAMAARKAKLPHVLLGVRVADPSWWRGTLERSQARRASGVVCVSQAVADFCRRVHQFPPGKLIVIPNGIDVAQVAATPPADLTDLGISTGRKLLTYIGRLDRQKDPGWLVGIALDALPQLPDHDLVVVGDERRPGDMEDAVRLLPPLQGRVHVLGWRRDAHAILAASQMLLLTSKYEGMPNVVLEAMSLGKPVMASRVEGVVELLGPTADDQSSPWRDTNAFVRKLVELASDPARCEQLGAQNQIRAREHFSLSAMIANYARLYEGLAAG